MKRLTLPLLLLALAGSAHAAEPAKEPTPAELKAQNAQLSAENVQLKAVIRALRQQRDNANDVVAELAARLQTGQH